MNKILSFLFGCGFFVSLYGMGEGSKKTVSSLADEINKGLASMGGETPLHALVAIRNLRECPAVKNFLVQSLIDAKAKVDASTQDGFTPLHYAVMDDLFDIAQTLCKAQADVNLCDSSRRTAIFEAKSTEMVDLLVAHGADLVVLDNNMKSPVQSAQEHSRGDIADYLGKVMMEAPAATKKDKDKDDQKATCTPQ